MCIEMLLFVIIFCPLWDIRKAINFYCWCLVIKLHAWAKFSFLTPQKKSSWCETAASSNTSLISPRPYSTFIFSRQHLQILLYLQIFHLKNLQPQGLINSLNLLLAQVLGDYQAVHRSYHQVLFVHLLPLLVPLLMFVFENHID